MATEIKSTTTTVTHRSFSIEAPFSSSVTFKDLEDLLNAAKRSYNDCHGHGPNEPIHPDAIAVHFKNGTYVASFDVKLETS